MNLGVGVGKCATDKWGNLTLMNCQRAATWSWYRKLGYIDSSCDVE